MLTKALTQREAWTFAAGQWRPAPGGEEIPVINPSTGQEFARVTGATPQDVDAAVRAACEAYPEWRRTPGTERVRYLREIAAGLKSRRADLVQLQMMNNGKPMLESETDVDDAVATFEYYADLAADLDGRQGQLVEHAGNAHYGRTRFEPIGPVAAIVPWNFPLVTSAWKIAPALAAGCTMVMKTSEMTPLAELAYADIAVEIGLPAGVLNMVTGAAEVGQALTADRRFRKLSFTGSNAIGSRVMAKAAERCVPISLELGGKSPIVVLEDADVETAVESIAGGIFYNCGQMCSATSRLIVDRKIAPAVLEGLCQYAKEIEVGSPVDAETRMGPITTRPQFDRVCDFLDQARRDGIDCLTGGDAGVSGGGFFVQPTVYMDVPTDNRIWRDEIFGPVLAVRTFETEAEALALANDSEYALVATIVSGDVERAESLAAWIDGGHVWINTPQVIYPNSAWGGFKSSGIGRELGPWGLSAYQGVKHLTVPTYTNLHK